MTEFGSGAPGAKKLLELVKAGKRPKPPNISDDTLRIYRDFVQKKHNELTKAGKGLPVMRDRLEIYKIWLGE